MKRKFYFIFLLLYGVVFSQSTKSIDEECNKLPLLFKIGKKEEAVKLIDHIILSSNKLNYSKGRVN